MLRNLATLSFILITTAAFRISAQVYPYRDGTPGLTGYRSEVMAEVMIQESEFVRLAEAIPADKYTWRPSADVRTIAEVFLHASAANYNLYKLVGTPTPAGVDTKTLEQVHHRQSKNYRHAQSFLRTCQGSYPRHARLGSGKDSGLERREDYRTRRPALHRSAHRAAPRAADRLRPVDRRRPAMDNRSAPEQLGRAG